MSAREPLEGLVFGDFTVIEYLGKKKYLMKCNRCGKTKEAASGNIKANVGVTCSCSKVNIDLTGDIIGDWKVLEYIGHNRYKCRCSCGKIKDVLKVNLLNGSSMSCGHKKNSYGDLTGKQFGEWTVVGKSNYLYDCVCSCGKKARIGSGDLVSGKTKSCGHSYNAFHDISGQQFGHWTVLEYEGNQYYKCQCDCNNRTIKSVRKSDLVSGRSESCGCYRREKAKQTLLGKYGDTAPNKVNNPRSTSQQEALDSKESLIAFIDNLDYTPSTIDLSKELGIGLSRTLVLLHKFEIEDRVIFNDKASQGEKEVADYIRLIYKGEIELRNREILNGKELDIYLPDKKLAIEFNGSYWHSDIVKSKKYHYEKTVACGKLGIRLIHIFEYEWNNPDKQVKIKQLLYHVICNNNVIYARDTEIKHISESEANRFEDMYHLQGRAHSSINLALIKNNDILALLAVDKPRFNNNIQYEIIRICFKADVSIVGGLEKLFKHFIREFNPKTIISYCDLSKFYGESYTRLGFKLMDKPVSDPNYVWVNTSNGQAISRYKTQKRRLVENNLGNRNQTEDDIMRGNNYLKIYDCGNLRFIWNNI